MFMNAKLKKSTILTCLFFLTSIILSHFVAGRGRYVDSDYVAYEYMFNNYTHISVEPIYKIISFFVKNLNFDFTILLFIFCFFSILLKIYSLILAKKEGKVGSEGLVYFLFFYFFCFFALWDLTQIRASLSISFLMLSFFVYPAYIKFFFKLLALLSHYSISFVLFFEFIYYIVKRNILLHITFTTIFCVCLYFLIGFTPYAVYDSLSYSESFNPLSFKNIFIIVSFFMVLFFYKNNDNFYLVRKLSALSISLLIMYYIFGLRYPSVAIRVADLSLFFGLLSLTFVRSNSVLMIYKYISLIILSVYFTYIFYMADDPVISLDEWGVK